MVEITINGRNLHEVRMPLMPHAPGIISSLSYPKERMRISENENEILIQIPSFLTLELLRQGILLMEKSFELGIRGKSKGKFTVVDLSYPTEPGNELINIRVRKVLQPLAAKQRVKA